MKKIVLLPLLLFALTACNSGSSNCTCIGGSSEPKETVSLTKDNFSKYVTTNSTCSYHSNNDYANYYTYFVGAKCCKFISCEVTYVYTYQGAETTATSGTTITLTIAGDGEALPYVARTSQNAGYYALVVISASGTVQVYR